ncbi:hypothetical protein GCM10008924_24540 [Gracilibacillus halotolerans]
MTSLWRRWRLSGLDSAFKINSINLPFYDLIFLFDKKYVNPPKKIESIFRVWFESNVERVESDVKSDNPMLSVLNLMLKVTIQC